MNKPSKPTPPKTSKAGRWGEFNPFVDVTLRTLTPSEVRCWLVLWRDLKAKTGLAKAGQLDIARRTGLSERQVRYAMAGLVKKKLVRVVVRGRLGSGASTYRVRAIVPTE